MNAASGRGRDVSFVVIAFNEETNIGSAIESIVGLDGLGDYEVIVVDDGSKDRTRDIVRAIAESNDRVRLVGLSTNSGRGCARAVGVNAAQGDLIATVDADIVLRPSWLGLARAALAAYDAVGGTAIPDGDVSYIHKRFRLTPRAVRPATSVTGSNALYRRSVFDVIQFDTSLREGEDCELNYMMDRYGLLRRTVPGLVVEHRESKSLLTSIRWLFESGRGATRQLARFREIRQPDVVTVGFVAAVLGGVAVGTLRRSAIGAALPACFVLAASVQHVRSRFIIGAPDVPRAAAAVGANCLILTAYFSGRIVGVADLVRPMSHLWFRRALGSSTRSREMHRRERSESGEC